MRIEKLIEEILRVTFAEPPAEPDEEKKYVSAIKDEAVVEVLDGIYERIRKLEDLTLTKQPPDTPEEGESLSERIARLEIKLHQHTQVELQKAPDQPFKFGDLVESEQGTRVIFQRYFDNPKKCWVLDLDSVMDFIGHKWDVEGLKLIQPGCCSVSLKIIQDKLTGS